MKIAICLTGQPRTWKRSGMWWKNMFQQYDNTVDVFYHLWNYNTVSMSKLHRANPQTLTKNFVDYEEEELINFYQPKKHIFDKSELDVPNHLRQFAEHKFSTVGYYGWPTYGEPNITSISHQYYSWMMVANLKRQYELENNFEYDVCIHGRTDLDFTSGETETLIKSLPAPKPNTIYTVHNIFEYSKLCVGDIFFYSDSLTFDKISNYIRGSIYYIDGYFPQKKLPEEAFVYYLKMLNITISALDYRISPRVVLSKEHAQQYGIKQNETV